MNSAPTFRFGWHESPFGPCFVGTVRGRLACLAFAGRSASTSAGVGAPGTRTRLKTVCAQAETALLAAQIFKASDSELGELPLWLEGTAFQRRVWEALREVRRGETVCYGALARKIGHPQAARAVGAAVGANPIAYVVPCHRVVRADGRLGGFRWGLPLKRSLLRAEGCTPG